ncbi:hypothetical protein BDV12DRAFT_198168 [Aspergillus spectabilis]
MTVTAEQALSNLRDAGLCEVLYFPGQEKYNDRVSSHWSLTAQLRPWAIVQPRNTDEVAKAVKAIVTAPDVKFAVRSGGHMQWAGASSIVDGITIDLRLMNNTSYNAETEIVSLQPGGYWGASYKELEKYQVVNFEVVLADGRIINANNGEYPDLFLALKGGGNNFGIVTRFDMVTFPARDIRNSTITCHKQTSAQVSKALVDFTKNLTTYPDDHLLAIICQPLPASVRARSIERGGNMLGLDHIQDDCIQLVWAVEVETAELNDTVSAPLLKKAVGEIEAYARSIDGSSGFLYLNYCDSTQDPLSAYGEENLRKMKDVSATYDPEGVFQRTVPGGVQDLETWVCD